MKLFQSTFLAVCLTLCGATVFAFDIPTSPIGHVNDYASLLEPEVVSSLESELRAFQASTTHEIVVVTVPGFDGKDTIEDFSVKLFEKWGIGKKGVDNGLLFILARDERKAKIEVGYGLEGVITDTDAANVLKHVVLPAFKEGSYEKGIVSGVRMLKDLALEEQGARNNLNKASTEARMSDIVYGIVVGLSFIASFLANIFASSKRWWPGGVVGLLFGFVAGIYVFGVGSLLGVVGAAALTGLIGLIFDYFVSKHGPFVGSSGGSAPFGGGFGGFGGGGGGFGGFGGGRSGGGGATGSW